MDKSTAVLSGENGKIMMISRRLSFFFFVFFFSNWRKNAQAEKTETKGMPPTRNPIPFCPLASIAHTCWVMQSILIDKIKTLDGDKQLDVEGNARTIK